MKYMRLSIHKIILYFWVLLKICKKRKSRVLPRFRVDSAGCPDLTRPITSPGFAHLKPCQNPKSQINLSDWIRFHKLVAYTITP
jgi:hypothetical protein